MWNGSSSLFSGQSNLRGQPVKKYMTAKTRCASTLPSSAAAIPDPRCQLLRATHSVCFSLRQTLKMSPVMALGRIFIHRFHTEIPKQPTEQHGQPRASIGFSNLKLTSGPRCTQKQKPRGPSRRRTILSIVRRLVRRSICVCSPSFVSCYAVWTGGVH